MDYASCYVVYVDRTACEDRLFSNDDEEGMPLEDHLKSLELDGGIPEKNRHKQLHDNIATLLSTFGGGKRLRCENECLNGMLTPCSLHM